MSKVIIEIDCLEAGQPRPYADSRYRATIEAYKHGVYTNDKVIDCSISEETAKFLASIFVRSFHDDPEWHQARLESLKVLKSKTIMKKELPFKWEVLIVQPFLD